MPINVEWNTEQEQIAIVTIQDRWSIDEFYQAFDKLETMVNGVNHPVIVILDLSQTDIPARKFTSVSRYMREKEMSNITKTIFVRPNTIMKVMINIMSTLIPRRKGILDYANDIESAKVLAQANLTVSS